MIKLIWAVTISTLMSVGAWAATEIQRVEVINAFVVHAQRHQSVTSIQSGVIDGRVHFVGEGPVYVTLRSGANNLSTVVGRDGRFGFYFLNDSNRFTLEAWTSAIEEAPIYEGQLKIPLK